jgi:hypothetical protein
VDPEAAGFIGGGGHDAPRARPPDEHRLAAEARVVEHLDRRVEGVEVDVEDGPAAHTRAGVPFFRSVFMYFVEATAEV